MAKILIPTPLRQFADKKDSVQLAGSTVGEVLKSLTSEYAELRRHLYNDEGKLRSFVNVYVNDEDIRYLNKEATPVSDGDTVSIVPSIAGGSAGVAAPPAPPGPLLIVSFSSCAARSDFSRRCGLECAASSASSAKGSKDSGVMSSICC